MLLFKAAGAGTDGQIVLRFQVGFRLCCAHWCGQYVAVVTISLSSHLQGRRYPVITFLLVLHGKPRL